MNESERRSRVYQDCAVLGSAQFLVSYNNDLLNDSTFQQTPFEFGIEIVDPQALMEIIQEAEIISESE